MMDEPVALRAATSGRHPAGASLTRPQEPSERLVVGGIARAVEGDSLVNEQSDAGAQGDGSGEECRVCGVGGELDGVGFGAEVEGLLDAGGVED